MCPESQNAFCRLKLLTSLKLDYVYSTSNLVPEMSRDRFFELAYLKGKILTDSVCCRTSKVINNYISEIFASLQSELSNLSPFYCTLTKTRLVSHKSLKLSHLVFPVFFLNKK
jgi:hypothetical protein